MSGRPALMMMMMMMPACAAVLAACQAPRREESETSPVGPSVLSAAVLREADQGPVDFQRHIRPILDANCQHCHNKSTMPGLVDFSSRRSVMTPGPYGPRVVPGNPDRSLIVSNLSKTHAPVTSMPPVGSRLTPQEVRILRKWITEGAVWPES